MSKINWARFMRAGLVDLQLTPEQFWGLTPAELLLMLGVDSQDTPMGKTALENLMTAFPDYTERGEE